MDNSRERGENVTSGTVGKGEPNASGEYALLVPLELDQKGSAWSSEKKKRKSAQAQFGRKQKKKRGGGKSGLVSKTVKGGDGKNIPRPNGE